jgi:hypothetical protein
MIWTARSQVDRVAADEQDAVALAHVVAFRAHLGVVRKLLDAVVQLIQVPVGLGRVPLFKGV